MKHPLLSLCVAVLLPALAVAQASQMYIDPADHEKVFREIHRVLAPGGRLLAWDVVFPERGESVVAGILFPVHAKLPQTEIDSGYGVRCREGQGADHFVSLAAETGFRVVSRRNEAGWFFLERTKAKEGDLEEATRLVRCRVQRSPGAE